MTLLGRVKYTLLVNLLILCPAMPQCVQRKQPFQKHIDVIGRVCSACKPGEYVDSYCTTISRNTRCTLCPVGYYMTHWNVCRTCQKCTQCSGNLMLTEHTPCTSTSDRSCMCKDGFYRKKKQRMCVRHNKCRPGHGVTRIGTPFRKVRCTKCSFGFFQPNLSSSTRCLPHQVCESGIEKRGNRKRDTLCYKPTSIQLTLETIIRTQPVKIVPSSTVYTTLSTDETVAGQSTSFTNIGIKVSEKINQGMVVMASSAPMLDIAIASMCAVIAILITLVCCCYFTKSKCQQSENHTSSTLYNSVNGQRYTLTVGITMDDIFWFLAKTIDRVYKKDFYKRLRVEQWTIDDTTAQCQSEGPTIEKYKVMLAWRESQGELATLDALLAIIDDMKLKVVKSQLIKEFCQVSPV